MEKGWFEGKTSGSWEFSRCVKENYIKIIRRTDTGLPNDTGFGVPVL
jgi:hypothetical protein